MPRGGSCCRLNIIASHLKAEGAWICVGERNISPSTSRLLLNIREDGIAFCLIPACSCCHLPSLLEAGGCRWLVWGQDWSSSHQLLRGSRLSIPAPCMGWRQWCFPGGSFWHLPFFAFRTDVKSLLLLLCLQGALCWK